MSCPVSMSVLREERSSGPAWAAPWMPPATARSKSDQPSPSSSTTWETARPVAAETGATQAPSPRESKRSARVMAAPPDVTARSVGSVTRRLSFAVWSTQRSSAPWRAGASARTSSTVRTRNVSTSLPVGSAPSGTARVLSWDATASRRPPSARVEALVSLARRQRAGRPARRAQPMATSTATATAVRCLPGLGTSGRSYTATSSDAGPGTRGRGIRTRTRWR